MVVAAMAAGAMNANIRAHSAPLQRPACDSRVLEFVMVFALRTIELPQDYF
jgi:hypothetical protein